MAPKRPELASLGTDFTQHTAYCHVLPYINIHHTSRMSQSANGRMMQNGQNGQNGNQLTQVIPGPCLLDLIGSCLEELWCFLTTASIPSRQLSPWQEDTVLICTPSITEAQTGPLFNATCLKHLGRGIARHLSNTIQFPQVDKTNKASCKLSRSC